MVCDRKKFKIICREFLDVVASSLAVGVPCCAYGQEEQAWYHGITANVQDEFIEVREVG